MRIMKTVQNLAVYTDGIPENPAILFIHGFPFDFHLWDKQVEVLREQFYCIRYDLRGLGKSEPGNGQYTMEQCVDDLLAVLDSENIQQAVVCGLSMGGYIAFRAIERNPERFKGLIVLDSKADADDNAGKIRRSEAVKHLLTYGSAGYVKAFVPSTMPKESIEKLGSEYTEMIDRLVQASPVGIAGCQLAMLSRTDTNASLQNISVPSLLICGELDALTPVQNMRSIAEKIPGSEFTVVAGAGHMTPLEAPEQVTKRILQFMQEKFSS